MTVAAILFALFCCLYGSTVRAGEDAYNGASRLALVQSIVEEKTLAIDHSLYAAMTKDKAYVHGHYYSNKAPGMSVAAAPIYWILYHRGISFRANRPLAERLLKIRFAVLTALTPAVFYLLGGYFASGRTPRLLASLALGAGTGLFVYAGVFASHAVVATLLTISLFSVCKAEKNSDWLWCQG